MLRLAAAVLVVASRGCLAQPEPGQCEVSQGQDGGRHLTCLHAHNVSAVAASLESSDTPAAAAASAVTSVSLVGCPDLGAAEDEEWRRIGARRTRFLDPGVPSFGEPRTILVRGSSEEEHEADN